MKHTITFISTKGGCADERFIDASKRRHSSKTLVKEVLKGYEQSHQPPDEKGV